MNLIRLSQLYLLYVTSVSYKKNLITSSVKKDIFRKQSAKMKESVMATLDHRELKFARRSNVSELAVSLIHSLLSEKYKFLNDKTLGI